MNIISDQKLSILRLISLEGMIEDQRLVSLLASRELFHIEDAVRSNLNELKREGMVELVASEYWSITEPGKLNLTESLHKKRKDLLSALKDNIWTSFKEQDSDLKKVCTMWQVMPDGSLNTHEDHEYDFDVIERLLSIHDRLCNLFGDDHRIEREFNGLLNDLSNALEEIDEGQLEFFVGTSVNSYHNLWRELHEDLLCTLGIDREE